jgi:integrase
LNGEDLVARTIRNAALDTRAARRRLKPSARPYWQGLEDGVHLGYLRRPGPGAWVARFYAGDQRYEQERIAIADDYADADGVVVLDYRQAQAKARARLIERAHGGTAGITTVRAACEAYLEYLEMHRKTAGDARLRLEAFVYPTLGDVEVTKLTAEQLRSWLMALAKAPARVRTAPRRPQQHREDGDPDPEKIRRRRSSANRTRTTFFAALNLAFRDGRVASDKAWRQVRPFRGVDAARLRYLTVVEAQRLINAADPELRPLVQAALQTGCRYGELGILRVQDFNADAGTLAIRTSKSGRPRHVVLTEEGAELFTGLAAGRLGGELLLSKADGSAWGKSHQDLRMRAACRRAKIEPPISIHVLRHTWASLAVMAGVPLMVVAKNLGHRDTRMVEMHYGHLAPSFVTDEIRKGAPRFGLAAGNVLPLSGGRRA